jgi:hypothetical protein
MNYDRQCEPTGTYIQEQIILLGDSIFDNAPYVSQGESVSEQLTALVKSDVNIQHLAVDGHVMAHIPSQLERVQFIPHAQHHAFLSCGGNDLLSYSARGLLSTAVTTIDEALENLHQVRESFRQHYQNMLDHTQAQFTNLTVCTVYDQIPGLSNAEQMALCLFNEVILKEATQRKIAVLDLRVLCDKTEDFAPISPIEPSKFGAAKIAKAIYEAHLNKNQL